MEVLGIEFVEKLDIKLPETDLNHNILVFKKVSETPSKYPREAGKPSKITDKIISRKIIL